jgi:hypothetical protein
MILLRAVIITPHVSRSTEVQHIAIRHHFNRPVGNDRRDPVDACEASDQGWLCGP